MKLITKRFQRRRVEKPADNSEQKALVDYIRSCVLPPPATKVDNFVPSRWIGMHGIELNEQEQLERIERWRSQTYQNLYRLLRDDERINCSFAGRSFLGGSCLHNGWYPTPDAEVYASMIYDLKPDHIVEIGSGFSTLIARRALDYAKHDAKLTVIDPEPRTDVEQAADRVILRRVEDSQTESLGLTERSLLFIDSSHVTRPRGDVPYLYCEVLPRLAQGTVVHFHDIFIPYDYPTCYDHLCWTEQYVLQSMLSHSSRYRTLLSTQYLSRHRKAEMQATFGPQVGDDELFYGASYWIEIQ